MTIEVSIAIPARNAGRSIARQLSALSSQVDPGNHEVVVCDNGSTDDTRDIVAAWTSQMPALRLVRATERSGVSYGRNAAARAAIGAKILFCDADDEVQPGWVKAMAASLDHADLVGGMVDISATNPPELLIWPGPPTPGRLPVAMGYRPYAVGASLGVRRSLFEELGGFDETYVGGTEEVDFAWRAQDLGRVVAYVPEAVVHYNLRQSLRAAWRQFFGYGRSYAQLASRFRDAPWVVPDLHQEVRAVRGLAESVIHGRWQHRHAWVRQLAWAAGRAYGARRYRVHPPL